MNKNKKIILLVIIMAITFISFINTTNASAAMYLECNLDNSCKDFNYAKFYRVTDNKGNVKYLGYADDTDRGFFESIWDYTYGALIFNGDPPKLTGSVTPKCWLKGDNAKNISNSCDDDNIYNDSPEEILRKGICPICVRQTNEVWDYLDNLLPNGSVWSNSGIVPFGQKAPALSTKIENSKYIIYSFTSDSTKRIMAEGYNSEGKYAYVGPDFKYVWRDEIYKHQTKLIDNTNIKGNYFEVDTRFDTQLIAGNGLSVKNYSVCEGLSETECKENYNYEILAASSGEGYSNLKSSLKKWISNENNSFRAFDDIMDLTADKDFMELLNSIKKSIGEGKEYDFKNVNMTDFINKLDSGTSALRKAFGAEFQDCGYEGTETNITSSIMSCAVYSNILGIRNIVDLAEKNDSEYMLNQGYIIESLYDDVEKLTEENLKELGYPTDLLQSSNKLTEYTELMYYATAYLKSRATKLNLDEKKINNINDEYANIVEWKSLDIYPVVDCETLLGEELINKINSYLNVIKIAVPIIVIGLGIADFTKAVFSDEENMKKAQKQFIKRLIIAILVFLTPTFVNLLLSLANKVWTMISPNSCGIFN